MGEASMGDEAAGTCSHLILRGARGQRAL